MMLRLAFEELFPQKNSEEYIFEEKYSKKFRSFNGSIIYYPMQKKYLSKASSDFLDVQEIIRKGFFLHLLSKVHKIKLDSPDMRLYENFIEKLGKFTPASQSDPVLLDSFNRMNAAFFQNSIEPTNLKWGSLTYRRVGLFSYQDNMITISPVLRKRIDLVDFVMFHEMLHKKHQFYKTRTGRHMHHHTAFREEEKSYPGFEKINQELSKYVRSQKRWFEW